MKLSDKEVELFFKLYNPLLVFVAQKTQKVGNISSLDDLKKTPIEKIRLIRDELCKKIDLIDAFIDENSAGLLRNELAIVREWKALVKGEFYILRYLKKYAVFLTHQSPPNAYGVLALNNLFEEFVGPYLPILVETVLLPFQGKIIYDGIIAQYPVSFGSGIRHELDAIYEEIKARSGITLSLIAKSSGDSRSDAERLKFYLRNQASRDINADRIIDLAYKNSELEALYHQEMGKIQAKNYKKSYQALGIKNAWFGILQGMIIAAGATQEEVEKIAKAIVPDKQREFVYIFQMRDKRSTHAGVVDGE